MSDIPTPLKSGSRLPHLVLDPHLYMPREEEVTFFKSQTGINDDEELKSHVIAVQKEAWEVVNYRCIQSFGFMALKISKNPYYKHLLELLKQRPDAILLDYACCFGNDARKAISDGFPLENVITSDIQQEFYHLGHRLFKTTPESYPVPFVRGDIFDQNHISPTLPCYDAPNTPRPNLKTLTNLTPLQGHVSAINVCAFFHLFGKDDQIYAAKALASLLSPLPDSIIFGLHMTSDDGTSKEMNLAGERRVYCFNVQDWKALWDGEIFEKGTVTVEAFLHERDPKTYSEAGKESAVQKEIMRKMIVWCVRRI